MVHDIGNDIILAIWYGPFHMVHILEKCRMCIWICSCILYKIDFWLFQIHLCHLNHAWNIQIRYSKIQTWDLYRGSFKCCGFRFLIGQDSVVRMNTVWVWVRRVCESVNVNVGTIYIRLEYRWWQLSRVREMPRRIIYDQYNELWQPIFLWIEMNEN